MADFNPTQSEPTVTLRVWYRHSLTERECDDLADEWRTAQYLKEETYDYGVPEDILIGGVVAYKLEGDGADEHWVRVGSAAPAIPADVLEAWDA